MLSARSIGKLHFAATERSELTNEVVDQMGCGSSIVTVEVVTPNAPLGPSTQTFNPGQTLTDLLATGENIQWYENPTSTGRMLEVPLPLSTPLVDSTTYYASQTINGAESTTRLPVTVTLSLGIANNAFRNFNFYPNPVEHYLSISNSQNIDELKVFNLLGQTVLSIPINKSSSQIDLLGLNSGIYLVKVISGNAAKTFRIIKQ